MPENMSLTFKFVLVISIFYMVFGPYLFELMTDDPVTSYLLFCGTTPLMLIALARKLISMSKRK